MSSGPSKSSKRSGKRPPSTEHSGNQVDFEFLNFSHPKDAKHSQARRTVRSHVTKQQHQKEQQQAAAAARRTRSHGAEGQQDPERLKLLTHSVSDPTTKAESSQHAILKSPETSSSQASSYSTPLQSPTGRINPVDLYPPEWHHSVHILFDNCKWHLDCP